MKKSYWLLALGCGLLPALAQADSTVVETRPAGQGPAPAHRPWWVGAWAGAANSSPFQTRHGQRSRDFYIAAVRVGRELDTSPRFAYDYYADIIPFLRQTNIPVEYRETEPCQAPMPCRPAETLMITETIRGFGVTPLGLQMRIWPEKRLQLAFGVSMGVVLYDKPVPDPDERRLNFMGDLSAGVQLRLGRSGQLLAGVRQSHTSNGFTAAGVNPGLDSRVLYLGATRTLGSGRPR